MKNLLALLFLFSTSLFGNTPFCPEPSVDETTFTPSSAIRIYPKDRAYTQGLVFNDGFLYESVGLYGSSRLYELAPQPGTKRLIHSLPVFFFAEGLAFLNGKLFQLTWKERTAFVYRSEQIESGEILSARDVEKRYYSGEGWGLASLGDKLVKSDGTSKLSLLDPKDLNETGSITVRQGENLAGRLNELEVVKGRIFSNVYVAQRILSIDPTTGCALKVFDVSALFNFSFPECEKCGQFPSDYVANGIAYDKEAEELYLTGKNWPFFFVFKY